MNIKDFSFCFNMYSTFKQHCENVQLAEDTVS